MARLDRLGSAKEVAQIGAVIGREFYAAYGTLLREPRRALHARIAEALRDRFTTIADAEPEVVAHHFTQAGLAEAGIEWWKKAGERALRSSAYEEAIAHLEKALVLAGALAESPAQRLLRLRLQIANGRR